MSESGKFVKSDDFWIFWIVAVPVSIMTILWWKITLSKKWWKDKMSKIREDGLAGTMKRCENRFLAMVKRGKELQADDGTDGTSTRAKSDSV
jgi:hypothetical protein